MNNQILLRLTRECSKWSLAMAVLFGMAACQQEDALLAESEKTVTETVVNTEALLTDFAEVLSKATYARQEVREFLKEEAVKQFDKNYDVLYALVRDKKIGEATFHDVLVEYSSEEEMDRIEAGLPLLNILIPEIAFFDINAANMDCEDAEIPVAISKEKVTSLYLNGVCEVDLEKGEVPDFHTFVVNENSRVIVTPATKGGKPTISFISPNYDGTQEIATTRAFAVSASTVGGKAIEAFKYFYQNASGKNSRALQRDYIYYGMTPNGGKGTLKRDVSEYISFIEVDPKAYFKIADQRVGAVYDDPYIKNESVSRKKKDFTEQELIDAMWTKGQYNFKVEIISASKTQPDLAYIPAGPAEIWKFNYERDYRHGTWFRKKKYTYKLTPENFEAKRYYLNPDWITFSTWDLSVESLYRHINFWEEDESVKTTYSYSYDLTKMNSQKIDGEFKFGLGTEKENVGVGIGISNTTTVSKTQEFKFERQDKDDNLGTKKIYFYDPIIDSKSGNDYLMHEYNTGFLRFGIAVK